MGGPTLGCKLDGLVWSRVGVVTSARGNPDVDGIGGRDLDGICSVGDDIDPWRIDGETKGVKPAARTSSMVSFGRGAGLKDEGAGDSRAALRKVTLDSSFCSILDFSLSFCGDSPCRDLSVSFPMTFRNVMVANSSVPVGRILFDRMAERKLCSREDRNRFNALADDSDMEGDEEISERSGVGWEERWDRLATFMGNKRSDTRGVVCRKTLPSYVLVTKGRDMDQSSVKRTVNQTMKGQVSIESGPTRLESRLDQWRQKRRDNAREKAIRRTLRSS